MQTIHAAIAVGVAALTASTLTAPAPSLDAGPAARATTTTIVVHADRPGRQASRHLLGVNHHFNNNGYRLWDPATDSPVPAVVARARQAGVGSVRFPGGTVANFYDWRRAIGPDHGCQVDGRGSPATGYPDLVNAVAFGPDEYMEFTRAIHGTPFIMVPFVVSTPAAAADWVEYMNAPAGTPTNPHGGVDWAEERAANGHPAPYAVTRWEIGNEQDHSSQRYWMSQDTDVAVRQYAFGASRTFSAERLGKACDHPVAGVASNGAAGQQFGVAYPPVAIDSVAVTIAGITWTRVDDLATAGPADLVFTVQPMAGTVTFGDGQHGAIPPAGAIVRASYRSDHEGFFAFARRMKEVDPHISVCSSWASAAFVSLAGSRHFDCLTTHPITSFAPGDGARADWATPVEGHDRAMLAEDRRRNGVARLLGDIRGRAPLWLTEFSMIRGDSDTYPSWATSASHAAYMASLYADWLRLGIPWGMGDDFLWGSDRAVLGPAPDYTYTAVAETREALNPMFTAGGRVLATGVLGNPVRDPHLGAGTYAALVVTAIRAADGTLHLLVVNRLPGQDVTARIQLDAFHSRDTAQLRRVEPAHFWDWNRPGLPPDVHVTTSTRSVGQTSFRQTFPASSITVIRLFPR